MKASNDVVVYGDVIVELLSGVLIGRIAKEGCEEALLFIVILLLQV